MYAFIDQPVTYLDNSGRFLLWAMRTWNHANEQQIEPLSILRHGFLGLCAGPALPHFHHGMSLLCGEAIMPMSWSPMGSQRIGEWEALLLKLWTDIASGHGKKADATLALLVKPVAVEPIVHHLGVSLKQLEIAGFDVSNLSLLSLEAPGI